MTIEEYTHSGSQDTFTYWLASKLNTMGSIWGGSEFKFGIFSRKDQTDRPDGGGASYSDNYAWYTKYGANETEAFARSETSLSAWPRRRPGAICRPSRMPISVRPPSGRSLSTTRIGRSRASSMSSRSPHCWRLLACRTEAAHDGSSGRRLSSERQARNPRVRFAGLGRLGGEGPRYLEAVARQRRQFCCGRTRLTRPAAARDHSQGYWRQSGQELPRGGRRCAVLPVLWQRGTPARAFRGAGKDVGQGDGLA
jgi:hypothetical protein